MIFLHTARAPENARTTFAMRTWGAHRVVDCPRTARDIGCDRGCFYVKDVFDKALDLGPDDVFAYTNNDVALVPEWRTAIEPAVLAYGCAYAHRIDVPKFIAPLNMQNLVNQRGYPGADLFAFTSAWWKENRDAFPDLVFGYEGWDFAMQWMMRKSGFDRLPVLCYHEAHQAFWSRSENLQRHPTQIVCRERATKWANEAGAQAHMGAPHNFLFHGVLNQDDWNKRPTLTVLGLAKDCGATVRPLLDSILIATAGFKSVRYVILANSLASVPILGTSARHRDRTIEELSVWKAYDLQNRLVREYTGVTRTISEISRFQKMAKLRNEVKDMSTLSDWNILIDMDTKALIDNGGMRRFIYGPNDYDAVATYGIRDWEEVKHWRKTEENFTWRGKEWVYYDLLAFESLTKQRMLWRWASRPPEIWYPHGILSPEITFTQANIIPPIGNIWHDVNSAFGPATFYRRKVFEGIRYDESTTQVEHCTFHDAMRAKGMKIGLAGDIIATY